MPALTPLAAGPAAVRELPQQPTDMVSELRAKLEAKGLRERAEGEAAAATPTNG